MTDVSAWNLKHCPALQANSSTFAGCRPAHMEQAAVQPTWHRAITDYFQRTFEDLLILRRVLRPLRICDIYDLFALFINLLTYISDCVNRLSECTRHNSSVEMDVLSVYSGTSSSHADW